MTVSRPRRSKRKSIVLIPSSPQHKRPRKNGRPLSLPSNKTDETKRENVKTIGFLDLDYDIRRMIYRHLLLWDDVFDYEHGDSDPKARDTFPPCRPVRLGQLKGSLAILRTCRTVYEEGLEALYGDNRFEFVGHYWNGERNVTPPHASSRFNAISLHPIFKLETPTRFLRHFTIRGVINSGGILFSVHLTNIRRIMYACPSLIDMIFEVELNEYSTMWKTPRKIVENVDRAISQIPKTDVIGNFDISRAAFIHGHHLRGAEWRIDDWRRTISLGFTRIGHFHPVDHKIGLEHALDCYWTMNKIALQATEYTVFEKKKIVWL